MKRFGGYAGKLQARRARFGYVFIAPWLVGVVFFFLMPLISSIRFAFSDVQFAPGGYTAAFNGWSNFYHALRVDNTYIQHLWSSVQSLLINVPTILVFSFFVALLLKQRFFGNGLAKAIFFLPIILSSGIFIQLQSNFGDNTTSVLTESLNSAPVLETLQSVNFAAMLTDIGVPENWVRIIVTPINSIYSVITNSGIQIFIFLAGLKSISPSLYEACHMEGGTPWEEFWKITFPMMIPTILVNAVFSIVDTFTSINNSVIQYAYDYAFQKFGFGIASAMNWIYFLILGVIIALVMWLISRKAFYYT